MHWCIGLSAAIGVKRSKSMTSIKLVADTPLRKLTLTLTLITLPTVTVTKPSLTVHKECDVSNRKQN